MSTKSMNKKGFTLIELLIVVVIIGILAAIAIPRFGQTRERAFVSAMQSDLRQVSTAQELYYQANAFSYASGIGDLSAYYQPSDNVTIAISDVTATGYVATATHASAPDWTCTLASTGGDDAENLTCTSSAT